MPSADSHWYMLTLVGKDAPGIVAGVTAALAEQACNLGETSMIRLGGNFTIMMMVSTALSETGLLGFMQPVAARMGLCLHVDPIEGQLRSHQEPDVMISLHGADRVGIVASVTKVLAEAGLNILDLSSDVGGSDAAPFYIMSITGQAAQGVEPIEKALDGLRAEGIQAHLQDMELMIG